MFTQTYNSKKIIGDDVWDDPTDQGIFLKLENNYNKIQNKAIKIENTNKYSIVTGDNDQDIFTIYTFQYNGNGQIKDICFESYENQFGNMGNQLFRALEFGVINANYMWIKGDNVFENNKTIIFFSNPLNCQVYRNINDSSIYQYQLENFGYSHIFHTYYSNQTVSLIVSSSNINGNDQLNLQAIRITIGQNCPQYCNSCRDQEDCISCVSANVQRNITNQCQCPHRYYQDSLSDNCLECPQYCESCSDFNTYQICIPSIGQRDISNLCYCKKGYYQDTESHDCLKCKENCATCSDGETCLSCLGDTALDLNTLQCKCKQNLIQYYDKIGQCKSAI
ncbi:Insulin-like growth factor binding protein, N-terminal [Pseudocohnilembus persalinus]|uniref:Insulin-like growth factor binding protein, N-terminal n=1 Tax=Pseudocohnilembus persalinus TaxID=266149 RepID=A0A0V0QW02_PSEPJ|nr:Insulin-like growth factor binding protein, N-terminal [Pseudocohnilembus persalinus]|eukprot:KRX06540.1 Insulin-like growth factor binding protein, N-terminal [Pseudocohnilembus persalinus]